MEEVLRKKYHPFEKDFATRVPARPLTFQKRSTARFLGRGMA